MILLALLVVCVATVPLAGGRLGMLADIRFKRGWAGMAAIALQYTILRVLPGGDAALHAALHMASYGLMFYFLAGNLKVPGLWLIGLGGTLNALAIAANEGIMPAQPEALEKAGILQAPGEFVNSAAVSHPKLWFLGDIFAVPEGFPLANVFSIGDIVLVIGAFVLLHRQCRSILGPGLARASSFAEKAGPRAQLLRENRSFRRLWVAQAISSVGDWIFIPAVYAAVVHGHAKASALSLLLIAQIGPGMVVGFFGGPFIDRFSRKWLMFGTDVLRAGAVGSMLLVGTPSLLHVYTVSLMLGVGGALFQPAFMAAVPNLVAKRSLAAANSFVGLTQSVAIMIGFPIGGFIVDQFGVQWGFTSNALSFAFSAALVAGTVVKRTHKVATENLITELADGFRYVRSSPTVRSVIVIVSLITLAAGVKSPLEPLFALDTLHAGTSGLGLLGAFWGGGMIAGSLIASWLDRRVGHMRMLTHSVVLVSIAVLLAAVFPVLAPVAILWVGGGIANTTGTVAYETILQERTDDAVLGRVMAALEASLQAGLLAGVGVAALTDTLFANDPARAGMALAGALFGVAAFASWLLLERRPERLDSPVFELRGIELVPVGSSMALLRVSAVTGATSEPPVLLVDDGSRVHRVEPLPDGLPVDGEERRYGYGVPHSLLARGRAALALELGGTAMLDLPRP